MDDDLFADEAPMVAEPVPSNHADPVAADSGFDFDDNKAEQAVAKPAPKEAPKAPEQPTRSNAFETQRKAVADRTDAMDTAVEKKDTDTKRAAADFINELSSKRSARIAATKADNIKDQQAYEQKLSQFQKSGAVWSSLSLLLDCKKPNQYSKNTETMRRLYTELAR